jgi:hypothetical protein
VPRGGTSERWDLILDGLGLPCSRPMRGLDVGGMSVGVTATPTDLDRRQISQDIPREWTSFEAGACYSQDVGVNGYAYSDGATGLWGPIMPIGRVRSFTPNWQTDIGYIRAAFEWKGKLYVVGQLKVVTLPLDGNGTTDTILDVRTAPISPTGSSNEIQSATLYKDHLIIGLSNGTTIGMAQFDGTSWLQAAGVPLVQRGLLAEQYWRIDGIGAFRLIGTNGSTTFAHTSAAPATTTTNGIFDDANWSTAIGNTTSLAFTHAHFRVTGLVVAPESILFLTEGGAMEVDNTARVVNRTPYWASHKASISKITNGIVAGNYAYLPHANGIDRWNVRNRSINGPTGWCGPGVGLENDTPLFGEPGATCYWQGGIFAAFYNGTDSWLLFGRDREELGVAGVGPLVWHSMKKFAGVRISGLIPVTATSGRPYLWIFAENESTSAASAWYMDLPDNGSAVADLNYGSGMQFEESGSFYLTRETLGHPGIYKALRRFELTTRDLNPAAVDVFADPDYAGFVRQGRATTSPDTTFMAATDRAKDLGIRLDLTGPTTAPGQIQAIRLTQRYAVRRSEGRVYTVRVGAVDRHGTPDRGRDPARVWDRLQRLLEAGPIDAIDELGARLRVDVVEVRAVTTEAARATALPEERVAEVTLVVLSQASRYGSARYGSDRYGAT